VIAEMLHMTVHRMRREMPQDEFIRWCKYVNVKRQSEELAALAAKG